MARLPVLSGQEVVRTFQALGWTVARSGGRQRGGVPLLDEDDVVPDHKEVAKGTLRSLIRDAGLTVAEFVAAVP
jgi:predicted RNA binding protein YcfA (HicA-like mRNA interferase family)